MSTVPDSCSPERIQAIRDAFKDPSWTPSYCSADAMVVANAAYKPSTTSTSTTTNTTSVVQSEPISTPVLIGIGLLILFLMKGD